VSARQLAVRLKPPTLMEVMHSRTASASLAPIGFLQVLFVH
jgi:hypothetical protein